MSNSNRDFRAEADQFVCDRIKDYIHAGRVMGEGGGDIGYYFDTLSNVSNGLTLLDMGFEGCIYALSNPSMPGLLKIGMTRRDLQSRVKELSGTTGVPTPFEIESYFFAENCLEAEGEIHGLLREFRVNDQREFFNCTLEQFEDAASSFAHARDTNPIDIMNGESYITKAIYNTASTESVGIESDVLRRLKSRCFGDVSTIATVIIDYFLSTYSESMVIENNNGSGQVTFFPMRDSVDCAEHSFIDKESNEGK